MSYRERTESVASATGRSESASSTSSTPSSITPSSTIPNIPIPIPSFSSITPTHSKITTISSMSSISDTETQSAAAVALLGLSLPRSSTSAASATSISDNSHLSSIGMSVTLSDDTTSSDDNDGSSSTGSTRNSKKRRSSDSSENVDDGMDGGKTRMLRVDMRQEQDERIGGLSKKRSRGTPLSDKGSNSPSLTKSKTDGWTDEMKRVYAEAAMALPPSGREQRRFLGDMRGRNEQLGLWVTLEIGTYCGRKRISSHSQTLKNHQNTDPELKKFLTTETSSITDLPFAWPPRLRQLVYQAWQSISNPPPHLPPIDQLDLSNISVPPIMVRLVRKDGVEIEMTLPEAIEYDKNEQRNKNREKKPVLRRGLSNQSNYSSSSAAAVGSGVGGTKRRSGNSPLLQHASHSRTNSHSSVNSSRRETRNSFSGTPYTLPQTSSTSASASIARYTGGEDIRSAGMESANAQKYRTYSSPTNQRPIHSNVSRMIIPGGSNQLHSVISYTGISSEQSGQSSSAPTTFLTSSPFDQTSSSHLASPFTSVGPPRGRKGERDVSRGLNTTVEHNDRMSPEDRPNTSGENSRLSQTQPQLSRNYIQPRNLNPLSLPLPLPLQTPLPVISGNRRQSAGQLPSLESIIGGFKRNTSPPATAPSTRTFWK